MRILHFLFLACVASAQTQPWSVCGILDSAADHQEVIARVRISGSYHHGFGLSEGLDGEPCPGWRRRFFTAPSVLLPKVSSGFGVLLTSEEEQMGLGFLFRLRDLSRRSPGALNKLTVTMRGAVVKKSWPWMFRRSDGSYMGNAFGRRENTRQYS
jgi:hypothetical protein